MAGHGPPPKSPQTRRSRDALARGEWFDIPAGARRPGDPPELPGRHDGRPWRPQTLEWWGRLWSKPVATMWDDADELGRLAYMEQLFWEGHASGALVSEMRQIEDRHGLNPKGMRDLRWRLGDGVPGEMVSGDGPKRAASERRRRALKVIDGGG